jgi:hypothetical protein
MHVPSTYYRPWTDTAELKSRTRRRARRKHRDQPALSRGPKKDHARVSETAPRQVDSGHTFSPTPNTVVGSPAPAAPIPGRSDAVRDG